ncbi:MAG: hypothetical protein JXR26_07310, partial [Balneolaceae bacterium]|nr:hypothetical protein [Balneolaceae bacterium]
KEHTPTKKRAEQPLLPSAQPVRNRIQKVRLIWYSCQYFSTGNFLDSLACTNYYKISIHSI